MAIGGFARLHDLLGLIKEVGGLRKMKELLEAKSGSRSRQHPVLMRGSRRPAGRTASCRARNRRPRTAPFPRPRRRGRAECWRSRPASRRASGAVIVPHPQPSADDVLEMVHLAALGVCHRPDALGPLPAGLQHEPGQRRVLDGDEFERAVAAVLGDVGVSQVLFHALDRWGEPNGFLSSRVDLTRNYRVGPSTGHLGELLIPA